MVLWAFAKLAEIHTGVTQTEKISDEKASLKKEQMNVTESFEVF